MDMALLMDLLLFAKWTGLCAWASTVNYQSTCMPNSRLAITPPHLPTCFPIHYYLNLTCYMLLPSFVPKYPARATVDTMHKDLVSVSKALVTAPGSIGLEPQQRLS